ncbi:hypothetical protein CDD83_3573 [Cordyceps sp. RAO-2017]|nr:hypothetical protein CDD83_3573 [Cordyceps sp. RAO-2017]
MKFTALVALAGVAAAVPADLEARTGGGGGGGSKTCSASGYKQVCCNGLLNCVVQVLGSNCGNSAYCCKTDASTGGLVNIALLNCVSL